MVFTPSRPSVESARKEEGENQRVQRDRGRHHRAGGVMPVEQYAGPAVKTSNPGLAPRGAEGAVGGFRAWVRIPLQGQLTHDCTPIGALCVRASQKLLELHREPRQAPASRCPADPDGPRGIMELRDETTATANADIRSHQTKARTGSRERERRVPPRRARTRPLVYHARFRDRAGAAECDRASRARSPPARSKSEKPPRRPAPGSARPGSTSP